MSDQVHHTISYIEIPSTDLQATKAFYGKAFGWEFQVWGESYLGFSGAGIAGGFNADSTTREPSPDGALVILYSDDLEASMKAVSAAGGTISMKPYGFPGGRRFHFRDPSGNELAIWATS